MNGSSDGFHPRISRGTDAVDPASSSHGKISALNYVVARWAGHWWILYDGKRYGGTRVFAAALREAVGTAREAGLQGFDARVFVEYDPAIGATCGPMARLHVPWTGWAEISSIVGPPIDPECWTRWLSMLPGRTVCAPHPARSYGLARREAVACAGQALEVSGLRRDSTNDPP